MNPRPQITAWLLFIATAAVYLSFPTRVYYWDGIAFAQAIEDASGLSASLVHPNHLLYNLLGYLFYKLLRSFGADIRAVTALQILNSLLAALCARVLFSILLDTLRSLYFAFWLTLVFAFSATWWKFSTDANAYIPSVLFLLISFYLVLPGRKPRPLLTAFTFFLSMAFHQLAVFMLPVLALGVYLLDGPSTLKGRALNAVYFSLAATVLIATAYASFFYLATGAFDVAKLIRWTTSYSPDADTGFHLSSNLQYSLRGQVRLFFGGRLNLLRGLVNPLIAMLLLCLTGAIFLFILNLSRNLGAFKLRLEMRRKTVLLLALLWTAVYIVFLFFWLPQNTFYRLFYLPALILVLGLALASVKEPRVETRALAAFAIAMALANFLFLIYPFSHTEKYPPLVFALQMNREWPAGTVIYYGAENSDAGLIRYFNPATRWRLLRSSSIETIERAGGAVWLETTAIDQLRSTPEGARWLDAHARSSRELNDSAYRISFVQVY